jgi:two-component system, NtrC family, sensor histidine kinase GlrK
MKLLPRPSFRHLLLVAFLLVALLLAAVSLRGLSTMEGLLDSSQNGARLALQLNGHAERLGEHTLTMERAARQYLVLRDLSLRQTFERASADAAEQLLAMQTAGVPAPLVERWQLLAQNITARLDTRGVTAAVRDAQVSQHFRELDTVAALIGEQVGALAEAHNAALQTELDAGRRAWTHQVAAAIALALVLALALAVGLARPLRRVEQAIVRLGENRLDERIDIQGPSDVRQIGRRLDALRQRLEQADADKARFLRHVSHELKTPLAAMREGVALLNEGVTGPLSTDQKEVARILADNTATLQARIEDLLRFNAAAFAAQRPVRVPTDLPALALQLVDEQQLHWRSRGLEVAVRCLPPDAPLRAEVDSALLGTALSNLLSNAIRFSPPGGAVIVTLQRLGDSLSIEVADEGPGVPEADRERIFEPFFRGLLQPAEGLSGTGIGLSIVAETVLAHGGHVEYRPANPVLALPHDAGPGARFSIHLPHVFPD